MIAEYYLTSSARGPSSLSLVLPEAVATLLPPINDYVPGGAFEGIWDVRVVDRARILRVAAWLHQLDMLARGDGMASQTLEAMWHTQGSLLDLFLTPMMGSLTFKEVVNHVLYENWHDAQSSLNDLRAHCAHIHGELDDLTKAHGEESDKSSWKRIKKEIDMRHKDLESLRVHISDHESNLTQDPSEDIIPSDDGLSGHGAEAEMATAWGGDDAPSESTMTQACDPPPTEGQTHAMEVDDEVIGSPPISPISPTDDDPLTGGGAMGSRQTWSTLRSCLLGAPMARVRKPPFRGPSPTGSIVIVKYSMQLPLGCLQGRNEAVVMDKEGGVKPENRELTTSEDSRVTLLPGVFHKFVS